MSYEDDNRIGCGPAAFLALVCSVSMFALGTCTGEGSKATLADRCARECSDSLYVDSWSDDTHICVCKNGHVAHIRTQATVLQAGRDDAHTKDAGVSP